MENFFNWISKPLPKDEVVVWFNIHNMIYEKIELYGDIFKTLNIIIADTYLGNNDIETKIQLSENDKINHFTWCWKKTIENFNKENIVINEDGNHKEYLLSFFMDTFYNQKDKNISEAIPDFLDQVFDVSKPFSKSDLDILTELYKLMEKNIQ
jgi:hypothetical protein